MTTDLGYLPEQIQVELRDTPQGAALAQPKYWRRLTVVSGGQTGVDRAALDLALELELPCRGWCPRERAAEDGPIDPRYPLQETASDNPCVRTELNVIDSDATLVVSKGIPKDGTALTSERARTHKKPLLEIDLTQPVDVQAFRSWIDDNSIRVLNIGGPRESHDPGFIYQQSRSVLLQLLSRP